MPAGELAESAPAGVQPAAVQPAAVLSAAVLAIAVLAGCSDGRPEQDAPRAAGGSAPAEPAGQRIEETVEAVLGGVPLRLEVADEPGERAVGLMGRTEVPPGTGMVFRFGSPVSTSFYMFRVPVPLTAVFVRDGVVLHVAQMEPCARALASACPLYGPAEPFDTVVETAPSTLPTVRVGDRLEYR